MPTYTSHSVTATRIFRTCTTATITDRPGRGRRRSYRGHVILVQAHEPAERS